MFRGCWCVVLAALGWLTLAGASPPAEKQEKAQPAAQQPDPQPLPPPPADEAKYRPHPSVYGERCYEDDQHNAADLCAQWRAAFAAEKAAERSWWANLLNLLALCTAVLGTAAVLWTLKLTRDANRRALKEFARARLENRKAVAVANEANRTTERIGQAQVRCYVTPIEVSVGFTPDKESLVRCKVKNAGQSPARRVNCRAHVWFAGTNGTASFKEQLDVLGPEFIDVPAGADEIISDYIFADGSLWIPEDGFWNIFADITLTGKDVFGVQFTEVQRFFGRFAEQPDMANLIALERSGVFESKNTESGTSQADQPRLL